MKLVSAAPFWPLQHAAIPKPWLVLSVRNVHFVITSLHTGHWVIRIISTCPPQPGQLAKASCAGHLCPCEHSFFVQGSIFTTSPKFACGAALKLSCCSATSYLQTIQGLTNIKCI